MADQSNEMGMVERVARAMCDGKWDAADFTETANGETPDEQREYWMDKARAAIEALRVPTAEMKAAEGAHWDYSCHTCGGLAEGWHIMIDAALSHDEVKGQPDDVVARFRRGETITLADLTRDLEDDPPA